MVTLDDDTVSDAEQKACAGGSRALAGAVSLLNRLLIAPRNARGGLARAQSKARGGFGSRAKQGALRP
jgi:hypothetical protein